jgi:hypothetical protein
MKVNPIAESVARKPHVKNHHANGINIMKLR